MGKHRIKPNYHRRVLRLPDLDHCKVAVLNSLGSPASYVLWDKASGENTSGVKPLSHAVENVSSSSSNNQQDASPTKNTTGGLTPNQLYEKFEFLQSNRANMVEFY